MQSVFPILYDYSEVPKCVNNGYEQAARKLDYSKPFPETECTECVVARNRQNWLLRITYSFIALCCIAISSRICARSSESVEYLCLFLCNWHTDGLHSLIKLVIHSTLKCKIFLKSSKCILGCTQPHMGL